MYGFKIAQLRVGGSSSFCVSICTVRFPHPTPAVCGNAGLFLMASYGSHLENHLHLGDVKALTAHCTDLGNKCYLQGCPVRSPFTFPHEKKVRMLLLSFKKDDLQLPKLKFPKSVIGKIQI